MATTYLRTYVWACLGKKVKQRHIWGTHSRDITNPINIQELIIIVVVGRCVVFIVHIQSIAILSAPVMSNIIHDDTSLLFLLISTPFCFSPMVLLTFAPIPTKHIARPSQSTRKLSLWWYYVWQPKKRDDKKRKVMMSVMLFLFLELSCRQNKNKPCLLWPCKISSL